MSAFKNNYLEWIGRCRSAVARWMVVTIGLLLITPVCAEDLQKLLENAQQGMVGASFHIDATLQFDGPPFNVSGSISGEDYDFRMTNGVINRALDGRYWVSLEDGRTWKLIKGDPSPLYVILTSPITGDFGKLEQGRESKIKQRFVALQHKQVGETVVTLIEIKPDPLPDEEQRWPRYWVVTCADGRTWIQRFSGVISYMRNVVITDVEYTKVGEEVVIAAPEP